jgi:hypothetical protein
MNINTVVTLLWNRFQQRFRRPKGCLVCRMSGLEFSVLKCNGCEGSIHSFASRMPTRVYGVHAVQRKVKR